MAGPVLNTPSGQLAAPSRPGARAGRRLGSGATPWIASAFVLLWVLAFAAFCDGQWGDNVEQLVWAHGIEWGYHKHPPLPTWLLAAAIAIAGPASWWPIALAGAATVATGWLTYCIARRLLGEPLATFALLAWGLQQAFSTRASLFNHNTLMMLAVAAAVASVLRALDAPQRRRWWLLAGVAAAAALLSKYQSVVPLAGVLVALWRSGALRSSAVRSGVLLAALLALAGMLPHLGWLVTHEFAPLAYASRPADTLGLAERATSVVGFLAQQVRLVLPALLLCALLASRAAVADATARSSTVAARTRDAWLLGLVAFPLAATVLAAPLFGLRLQNHWGFQCLQFAGLALAWALRRRVVAQERAWLPTAAVLHLVFAAVAIADLAPGAAPATRRNDAGYPAHELAMAVARDWRSATTCPLRLVVGPSFEAGIVSAYNGGTARVLEDGEYKKSPWVGDEAGRREGAVYVATDLAELRTRSVALVNSIDVSGAAPPPFARVYWAIVPGDGCSDPR